MGKLESTIKTEITGLAKRELRKISVPLAHNVRALKSTVSEIRNCLGTPAIHGRSAKRVEKEKGSFRGNPGRSEKVPFLSRLIRSLRKKLGISQKELAILTGVIIRGCSKMGEW